MAHKVHPKAMRIRDMADWESRGYYERKFPAYLEEDFRIREVLKKKIGKMGVEKIEIERSPGKVSVIIFSARPGLIIGRGGGGVEVLAKALAKNLKEKKELKVEIKEVRNPLTSAPLVAQNMAAQIEKRMPFRRILKQTMEKVISQKGVEGARLEVSGRLDGVEISRREWLRKGRLPRQTLRADIDYAEERAFCTYGTIGIKVWIYKGEKF